MNTRPHILITKLKLTELAGKDRRMVIMSVSSLDRQAMSQLNTSSESSSSYSYFYCYCYDTNYVIYGRYFLIKGFDDSTRQPVQCFYKLVLNELC